MAKHIYADDIKTMIANCFAKWIREEKRNDATPSTYERCKTIMDSIDLFPASDVQAFFTEDEIALINEYKDEVKAVDFKTAILNAVSVALDKVYWQNVFANKPTESAPSADVREVKHGHWVDDNDPSEWTCSECHYRVMRYNNTAFCPNCGADMRGDE